MVASRNPLLQTALIDKVSDMLVVGSPSTNNKSARAPANICPLSVRLKRLAGIEVAARSASIGVKTASTSNY